MKKTNAALFNLALLGVTLCSSMAFADGSKHDSSPASPLEESVLFCPDDGLTVAVDGIHLNIPSLGGDVRIEEGAGYRGSLALLLSASAMNRAVSVSYTSAPASKKSQQNHYKVTEISTTNQPCPSDSPEPTPTPAPM